MGRLGRYEIIEQIGQGTMGTVYKAHDPIMDRDVAIKTILLHAIEGPEAEEFRERFFLEAKAAGRLAHPGIVTVFDVSEHEGTPFLVMEYVAGDTLQSILQSGERMSLERVRDVGIQLAEALDYAHENGVIHRDIKPANILLTKDGRIKITDFGVAKLIESHLTSNGRLIGTPAFMAPEQFAGMPVDARADVFALGVVLYFMATGEKPFSGDTVLGVQYKVVHTDPVGPRKLNPGIPEGLEVVILKAIEKDPLRRYQSGEELARALRTASLSHSQGDDGTELVTATLNLQRAQPSLPTHDEGRRRGIAAKVLLVPCVVAFLGLTTFILVNSLSHPQTPPAQTTAQKAASNPEHVPLQRQAETVAALPAAEVTPDETLPIARVSLPPKKPAKAQESIAENRNSSPVNVAVLPPEPEVVPHSDPVVPVVENKQAENAIPVQPESNSTYSSSHLLITSANVPEPVTIIVTIDNELLFRRDAVGTTSAGIKNSEGQVYLGSLHTTALSDERPLPPGRHKVQVTILLAAQRLGPVQEITDRFYPGQRRVLQIEFLPDAPRLNANGHDAKSFSIALK